MEDKNKGVRLQVVLARFGLASRRGAVEMIEQGKVFVNGVPIREKGHRVDPEKDKITVAGEEFKSGAGQDKRYFVLHKPRGVMTTLQDPHAESAVGDFFTDVSERVFPVGRLDRDTTGLLIVTNDGELAFRLTHPKFGVKKKYEALVKGCVTDAALRRFRQGINLEEGKTAPCAIEVVTRTREESHLRVTLHEGKKRQIRRMFEAIGHRVIALERVAYGPLTLGTLKPGERRELRSSDVAALRRAVGL